MYTLIKKSINKPIKGYSEGQRNLINCVLDRRSRASILKSKLKTVSSVKKNIKRINKIVTFKGYIK